MPPDSFLWVGLRGVARELFEVNPASSTGGEELLDGSAPVDRCSIPDYEQLAGNVVHEVTEEAHDFSAPDRMLVHLEVESFIE
jgi:hypothetical protein